MTRHPDQEHSPDDENGSREQEPDEFTRTPLEEMDEEEDSQCGNAATRGKGRPKRGMLRPK